MLLLGNSNGQSSVTIPYCLKNLGSSTATPQLLITYSPPFPGPLQTKKAAAYERGVADRGKQAEAEALQLQDAAEKALEEVKQGARTTIDEMTVRHSEELEAERK